MRSFWNFLFSSKLGMLVLSAFIIIIGVATFIEEKYDTSTAKLLIYHATWFEIFMLVLVVLFIITSSRKKLFCKEKIPQLVFHFSFIFIIIGGGVSRYFGFEADMHILENQKVNVIYTLKPFFQIRMADENIEYTSPTPLYFSQLENNDFHLDFGTNNKLTIDYQEYFFNENENIPDTLFVALTYNGNPHKAALVYDKTRYTQPFQQFNFGDLGLEMVYGPKPIEMPFALQLNQFTLTNYPGTDIPSSSESKVVLIDDRENLKEEHVIYKNHVLDYDGYRFFQTSYDDDEKGTILSVNYDYYGTRITYFGYILMALGAILILFNKNTYFSQLDSNIKKVRAKRKALMMSLLLFGFTSIGFSQNQSIGPISSEHADNFGHLLVQTYDGRFSSVHSLATDVVHKISGKDNFTTAAKGEMNTMQVFLDMHLDPEFWKNQKIIVIREQSLREILGVTGKHASYYDFSNNSAQLTELHLKAFHKKASEQTTFDREIIKVTERMSIFLMTINGTSFKLFPHQTSSNNQWLSWNDSLAFTPLTGELLIINEDLRIPEFTYSNIMKSYLISTVHARQSNDYAIPNKIMGYIKQIQRHIGPTELIPSEGKIKLEVLYNKSKIFDYLKYAYALLGLALLALTFIRNFKANPSKKLQIAIKTGIVFFAILFVYQTFGMGLRWYLGGHAPWSNGYEVILLVAWGTILAGFSVINYSKITVASTAILASLLLMVAGHSYYDPQLTNLNPVLKSYWLIIHVAIITIGYGFLALSFIMGLINIILELIKPKRKEELFSLVIEELTYINEKLLTRGLFLAAIGTYIGCVWANESWGTYWEWNAKQVWSIIIVLAYGVVLHFKFIPKMKSHLAFNIASVISFASVIMTFVGVNYYFTKGLHSYASDDPPVFPIWAWVIIITLLLLMIAAVVKERYRKKLKRQ